MVEPAAALVQTLTQLLLLRGAQRIEEVGRRGNDLGAFSTHCLRLFLDDGQRTRAVETFSRDQRLQFGTRVGGAADQGLSLRANPFADEHQLLLLGSGQFQFPGHTIDDFLLHLGLLFAAQAHAMASVSITACAQATQYDGSAENADETAFDPGFHIDSFKNGLNTKPWCAAWALASFQRGFAVFRFVSLRLAPARSRPVASMRELARTTASPTGTHPECTMPHHPALTDASRRILTVAAIALPFVWTTARAQTGVRPTPAQTEGPFYPLSLPRDSDPDLLHNGDQAYGKGQPGWVQGTVTDTRGQPLAGALVEIWQCDAGGHYHHPGDGARADPAFQGFGKQSLGPDGRYRFRTIRPVAYSGRTPHIHVKVRLGSRELLTTQLYVRDDPHNSRDFLWRQLRDPRDRDALTIPFESTSDGFRAEFGIVVAT